MLSIDTAFHDGIGSSVLRICGVPQRKYQNGNPNKRPSEWFAQEGVRACARCGCKKSVEDTGDSQDVSLTFLGRQRIPVNCLLSSRSKKQRPLGKHLRESETQAKITFFRVISLKGGCSRCECHAHMREPQTKVFTVDGGDEACVLTNREVCRDGARRTGSITEVARDLVQRAF